MRTPFESINKAAEIGSAMDVRRPNTMERVDNRIKEMEYELSALREMRDILDKNQDIQRLLTLMERVHF